MAAKGYTTEQKIETFLNVSITTGQADDYIEAAEKLIDNYTGRNFKADTNASARQFDGNGGNVLPIDDCIAVTVVKRGLDFYADSEETVSSGGSGGYYLLPNNYSADGVPIRAIHLRDKVWYHGLQNHEITAKWGYSVNPPDDIEIAATIIAAGLYHYNRGGASGQIASEKIGNYAVSYPDKDKTKAFIKQVEEILVLYAKPVL